MSKLYNLSGSEAVPMEQKRYDKEADLQRIIADNPNLIRRNDDETQGIHYYLISQEQKLPDTDFSLDHLMVDETGVPILVEVKRSTDTRIRREVVAQMIEYASYAKQLRIDALREDFKVHNSTDVKSDDFWNCVEKNLREENLRLVFVADEIPQKLRMMMDFLNRSMPNIEVYGVEIIPFDCENDTKMLTVNTIEDSAKVEQKRESNREYKQWDEASFVQYLHDHDMHQEAANLPQFVKLASQKGFTLNWGKGVRYPSVSLWRNNASIKVQAFLYNEGPTCAVEVKTYQVHPDGAEALDAKVKERFCNSIAWKKYNGSHRPYVWDSNQYLFISLRAFDNQKSMEDCLDRLSNYADLITNQLPIEEYCAE